MSSGIATQRRTGAPVVGEVLMDASISSSNLLLPMLAAHVINRSTDLKHISFFSSHLLLLITTLHPLSLRLLSLSPPDSSQTAAPTPKRPSANPSSR